MKSYFILIDTETTLTGRVADFAAVICDRKGNVVNQCAVLVDGIYTDRKFHPLFYSVDGKAGWTKESLGKRYAAYENMLAQGSRMVARVPAINAWLAKAFQTYKPILTAYNLSFDLEKCLNTVIDLSMFERRFCLWFACVEAYADRKKYRKMCLDLHAFNAPTKYGNMSYKTNAETMARFCTGRNELENEPHTALEDILYYELPCLQKLCKGFSNRWMLENAKAFDWRKVQVRDNFEPR
jgi:hypothetical protein